MSDEFTAALKEALAAPADRYVIWAQVPQDDVFVSVILSTIALPQSLSTDVIRDRAIGSARSDLKALGFDDKDIRRAEFILSLAPDAKAAVDAIADRWHPGDDDLVLLEFLPWEIFQGQTGLSPRMVDGLAQIDYRGLRAQQSGAG
jgi:hypothetical protein